MAGKRTALPSLQTGDATVGRRTLCIAVDESGHEEFKLKEAFFAIGGIAGLGSELVQAERQWRAMKKLFFSGPDEPLHASAKMLSREQIDGISRFFEKSRLTRFAYIIKRPPFMPPSFNALYALRHLLLEELEKAIADMLALPKDIVISMERSERLLPKIVAAFPSLSCMVDDRSIPIVGLFTPKLPPQPFLEMADQVVWRAQRQYNEYNPKQKIMPEFASVFQKNAPHSRYMELRIASMSGGSEPEWHLNFDEKGRVSIRLRGKKAGPNF